METEAVLAADSLHLRSNLLVMLVGAVTMALSSMDQCTKGPSVTGLVLSNLQLFI